jgi:glutamate 5-kinase
MVSNVSPRRLVVKVGTGVLTAGATGLNRARMVELARQIAALVAQGREVVLVTSGAVAAGRERLGYPKPSSDIPFKQMLAAVGQGRLVHVYEQLFEIYDLPVAQVLLTREDLRDRHRYLNARNTLLALLERRIVPIINENDAVATDEIRVGDNDNLSALVANLVEAELLVLLTDMEGLYTADPRLHPEATLIPEVARIDETIYALAGGSRTGLGTGGMLTKVQAAALATRGGAHVVVAAGAVDNVLLRLAAGERLGTLFAASTSGLEGRKRWILAETAPEGSLVVDAGAAQALQHEGGSLLPVGVTGVEGAFERGATVRIVDPQGREVARGVSNYSAGELAMVRGHHSDEIEERLGYNYGSEVVHRDNLVLLAAPGRMAHPRKTEPSGAR